MRRGIGLATAKRLGAEGARLVLTARGEDDGRDVEAGLRKAGVDAVFVAFLLSDEARFVTGATLPMDGGTTAG